MMQMSHRIRNVESILPFIDDSESKLLSYICLSGKLDRIMPGEINSLLSKGLLIEDGNKIRIAPISNRIISYYPLFGDYEDSQPYPMAFIPMLLSSIGNGALSQKESIWSRYLNSDFFTSIFPIKERGKSARAGIKAVYSFLKLGIASSGASRLILDRDKSIEFFNLDEYSKLAYIFFPEDEDEERRKAANAISLAFKTRNIKKEKIEDHFGLIEDITGFNLLPYLDLLLDFDVIYEKDDKSINGTTLQSNTSKSNGIISSDFIYSEQASSTYPLFLFLSPIKADIANQWGITKSSMRNAFSLGYTNKDAKEFLSSVSQFPLSSTIEARIDSWYESFLSLRAKKAFVLIANDRTEKILENLPLMKIHIIERIGNVFIMNPDTEAEWRNILTYTGFDMLGNTECGYAKGDTQRVSLISLPTLPQLPMARDIPYRKAEHMALIENAENPIIRAYIESGLRIDSLDDIRMIDGLFFQEKLKLIDEAIDEAKILYLEYADGKHEFIRPISIEKDKEIYCVTANGTKRCIDRIWKVALLDSFIKEQYL